MSERITVYTDGGCRPNPGPGGWGAVLMLPGGARELSGSEGQSTNNRMELTAAVRALEALPAGSDVELVTDSTYVRSGITRWLQSWHRNGWLTGTREPVKNRDLWLELEDATRRHRVTWRWARGHAGDPGNERAHALAASAIPGAPPRPAAASAPQPLPDDAVEAFLGVAWSGTHRRGAWGAVLRHRGLEKELAGRLDLPSANAAHIASAALALEAIKRPLQVRVVTASDYLRDGATLWLPAWRQRGWRTREGQPVASRDWWQRLELQLARLPVDWQLAGKDEPPPELARARQLARAALAGRPAPPG
jgi:ribonuclease HI